MPIYTVKPADSDEPPRLIDATSGTAALRHVTAPMFEVAVVQKMAVLAKLLSGGVKLETAGEAPEPVADTAQEDAPAEPGSSASETLLSAEAGRAAGKAKPTKSLFERMADKAPTPETAGDPLVDPETGEVFEKRETAPAPKGE